MEDSYSATITGSSGPITADLVGLDGQPTQAIPLFRLPGLAAGRLSLQASLATAGSGTVTIKVTSLTDATRSVTLTATINVGVVSLLLLDRTGSGALTIADHGSVLVKSTGTVTVDSTSSTAASVSHDGTARAQTFSFGQRSASTVQLCRASQQGCASKSTTRWPA